MNIKINGKVVTEPEVIKVFSKGNKLYQCYIENKRLSDKVDTIRVTYMNQDISYGDCIYVEGDVRSIKLNDRSNIYVHAKSVEVLPCIDKYVNLVIGSGILNRDIVFRRKKDDDNVSIADMILRESRGRGRHSYIYCSVWTGNVEKCRDFSVEDTIDIVGRLQSQKHDDGFSAEVSVMKLRKGVQNI